MMHLMRASRMALSLVAYSLRLSFRKIGRGGASCGDEYCVRGRARTVPCTGKVKSVK